MACSEKKQLISKAAKMESSRFWPQQDMNLRAIALIFILHWIVLNRIPAKVWKPQKRPTLPKKNRLLQKRWLTSKNIRYMKRPTAKPSVPVLIMQTDSWHGRQTHWAIRQSMSMISSISWPKPTCLLIPIRILWRKISMTKMEMELKRFRQFRRKIRVRQNTV